MQSGAATKIESGGSIAYDLSRFDKRKRVREQLEREPVISLRPIAKVNERAKAEQAARSRAVVSPFALVGFVVVAFLMLLLVNNYMVLYKGTMELSGMKSTYEKLIKDEAVLSVQVEQRLNLKMIGEKASELGMNLPQSEAVIYLDLSTPDYGVVVQDQNAGAGLIADIKSVLQAGVNFFK